MKRILFISMVLLSLILATACSTSNLAGEAYVQTADIKSENASVAKVRSDMPGPDDGLSATQKAQAVATQAEQIEEEAVSSNHPGSSGGSSDELIADIDASPSDLDTQESDQAESKQYCTELKNAIITNDFLLSASEEDGFTRVYLQKEQLEALAFETSVDDEEDSSGIVYLQKERLDALEFESFNDGEDLQTPLRVAFYKPVAHEGDVDDLSSSIAISSVELAHAIDQLDNVGDGVLYVDTCVGDKRTNYYCLDETTGTAQMENCEFGCNLTVPLCATNTSSENNSTAQQNYSTYDDQDVNLKICTDIDGENAYNASTASTYQGASLTDQCVPGSIENQQTIASKEVLREAICYKGMLDTTDIVCQGPCETTSQGDRCAPVCVSDTNIPLHPEFTQSSIQIYNATYPQGQAYSDVCVKDMGSAFNVEAHKETFLTTNVIDLQEHHNGVLEISCGDGDSYEYTVHECEYGCQDGACLESQCTDSDGGIDEFVAGGTTVISSNHATAVSDTCQADGTLLEMYCAPNGTSQQTIIECEYGCYDGACLTQALECHKEDEGDIFNQGVLELSEYTADVLGINQNYFSDVCAGGDIETLIEYSCANFPEDLTEQALCEFGCQDGACLREPGEILIGEDENCKMFSSYILYDSADQLLPQQSCSTSGQELIHRTCSGEAAIATIKPCEINCFAGECVAFENTIEAASYTVQEGELLVETLEDISGNAICESHDAGFCYGLYRSSVGEQFPQQQIPVSCSQELNDKTLSKYSLGQLKNYYVEQGDPVVYENLFEVMIKEIYRNEQDELVVQFATRLQGVDSQEFVQELVLSEKQPQGEVFENLQVELLEIDEDSQAASFNLSFTQFQGSISVACGEQEPQVSRPILSQQPGTYNQEELTLELSTSQDNAEIYYTLNGSNPTSNEADTYQQPIQLSLGNTTLRTVTKDTLDNRFSQEINGTYELKEVTTTQEDDGDDGSNNNYAGGSGGSSTNWDDGDDSSNVTGGTYGLWSGFRSDDEEETVGESSQDTVDETTTQGQDTTQQTAPIAPTQGENQAEQQVQADEDSKVLGGFLWPLIIGLLVVGGVALYFVETKLLHHSLPFGKHSTPRQAMTGAQKTSMATKTLSRPSDDNVAEVTKYVQRQEAAGYQEAVIKDHLLRHNYSEDVVNKSLELAKK